MAAGAVAALAVVIDVVVIDVVVIEVVVIDVAVAGSHGAMARTTAATVRTAASIVGDVRTWVAISCLR